MNNSLLRRKVRNSYRVKKNNKHNRPILNVYKSNKNIFASIIDDEGKVLAVFSSKTKEIVESLKGKNGTEIAFEIGKGIAKKAKEAKLEKVAFNKGPYLYIGRVKALAEGARDGGLDF